MYKKLLLSLFLTCGINGRRVHTPHESPSQEDKMSDPLRTLATHLLAISPAGLGRSRTAHPALSRLPIPQMSALSLANDCLTEGCPVDMVAELYEYLKSESNPSPEVSRTVSELAAILTAPKPNKNRMEEIVQGYVQIPPSEPIFVEKLGPNVDSVEVIMETDGRPLNARLELLHGPNKQAIELYTESSLDRPLVAVIDTPGGENVVRLVNNAPDEPIAARFEPRINGYSR